jgi:hypothetical protein
VVKALIDHCADQVPLALIEGIRLACFKTSF